MTEPPTEREKETSRRTFLKVTAAAGGVAGFSGFATAQTDQEVEQTFELDGVIPGWIGTPEMTGGDEPRKLNPTLKLEAGKTYEVRWRNGDGVGHAFTIIDKNGKWIGSTDLAFGTGTTKSIRFTAVPKMKQYYCPVHPNQMIGKIEVSGQTDKGPGVKPPKDISPVKEKSSITFNKQKSDGKTVTVKSTTLPKGGFVTIHNRQIMKKDKTVQDVRESVIGFSDYLEPGTHKGVTVTLEKKLDPKLKPGKLLIAMNHRDSNGNKTYDFVTKGASFADADWPYFTPKGRPVIDPDIVAIKEK